MDGLIDLEPMHDFKIEAKSRFKHPKIEVVRHVPREIASVARHRQRCPQAFPRPGRGEMQADIVTSPGDAASRVG